MNIIKRFGTRVLLPLFLSFVVLIMMVAVPMNASQYIEEENTDVESTEKQSYSATTSLYELHQKIPVFDNVLNEG